MPFCSKCGTKVEDDSRFCGECGTPVANARVMSPPQATTTAASVNVPPITADVSSSKSREAAERAEKAKYAVDAAVDVAGSAAAAAASVSASGAAIVGEISKRALSGVNATNPEIKKKVIGSLVLIAVIGALGYGAKAMFFSPGPEATVRAFYYAFEAGDAEQWTKFLAQSSDAAAMARDKEKITYLANQAATEFKSKGGIATIDPKCAEDESNVNRLKCNTTLTFKNGGAEGPNPLTLRKIDGKWKLE